MAHYYEQKLKKEETKPDGEVKAALNAEANVGTG